MVRGLRCEGVVHVSSCESFVLKWKSGGYTARWVTITAIFLLEERVTKVISDWQKVRACLGVSKIVGICGVVSYLSLLSKHVEVTD